MRKHALMYLSRAHVISFIASTSLLVFSGCESGNNPKEAEKITSPPDATQVTATQKKSAAPQIPEELRRLNLLLKTNRES